MQIIVADTFVQRKFASEWVIYDSDWDNPHGNIVRVYKNIESFCSVLCDSVF